MKQANMTTNLSSELNTVSHSETNKMPDKGKVATIIWIVLILLSSLAAYIGEFTDNTDDIIIPLLLILVIKSQLIIDYFMDLKHVRIFWRLSMSAFAIVISVIIWGVL